MSDAPIAISATPTAPQIAAALRQIVLGLGPLAGMIGYQGWFGDGSAVLTWVGPVSALVAFVWGQFATRKHAQNAAAMAMQLPDSVAVMK